MPAMPPVVRRARRTRPSTALALLAALALSACAGGRAASPPPTPVIASGDALLEAMHRRYAGQWYRTLTFVQRTVQTPPTGGPERRSVWYEAMSAPGRLRIDTDSTLRNGQLFANDSQYVVLNGQVRRAAAGHNVLQVLGFDVYAQPTSRTAAVLRQLGFPMTPVREDTWQGRPVYVVGARAGDLHRHQFWIDRERLVFVRLLQPFPGDTSQTFEVRFNKYRPLAGGWIAPEVEAYVGAKRILFEEYDDVRANVALDPSLFDPRRWAAARHWRK
jgi:hypothetical protein